MDLKFVNKSHVYLDGERLHRKRGQRCGDFTRDVYYNDKYIVKIDFSNEQQSFMEYRKEKGFWYNEFVGCVFLVKNNPNNRKNYVVADGCGWIEKKDTERIEIETWTPI